MRKINLLALLLFITANFGCERDDICPESTPTTPSLIIDIFDIDNQESKKNVFGLLVAGFDHEEFLPGYGVVSTDNLGLLQSKQIGNRNIVSRLHPIQTHLLPLFNTTGSGW